MPDVKRKEGNPKMTPAMQSLHQLLAKIQNDKRNSEVDYDKNLFSQPSTTSADSKLKMYNGGNMRLKYRQGANMQRLDGLVKKYQNGVTNFNSGKPEPAAVKYQLQMPGGRATGLPQELVDLIGGEGRLDISNPDIKSALEQYMKSSGDNYYEEYADDGDDIAIHETRKNAGKGQAGDGVGGRRQGFYDLLGGRQGDKAGALNALAVNPEKFAELLENNPQYMDQVLGMDTALQYRKGTEPRTNQNLMDSATSRYDTNLSTEAGFREFLSGLNVIPTKEPATTVNPGARNAAGVQTSSDGFTTRNRNGSSLKSLIKTMQNGETINFGMEPGPSSSAEPGGPIELDISRSGPVGFQKILESTKQSNPEYFDPKTDSNHPGGAAGVVTDLNQHMMKLYDDYTAGVGFGGGVTNDPKAIAYNRNKLQKEVNMFRDQLLDKRMGR